MISITPSSFDYANHNADATEDDIRFLTEKVLQYGFNSAFVNPIHVKLAKSLVGNNAKVGTVISFPLGQDILDVKVHAIREAIQDGADELDVVPDISLCKEDKKDLFEKELVTLVQTAKSMRGDIIVKFIIETGLFLPQIFLELDTPEIQKGKVVVEYAAKAFVSAGADFIKICSGMGKRGVSLDDVRYIRSLVGPDVRIKGAGGIKTKAQALALLEAGANRLGTSHAPAIIDAP